LSVAIPARGQNIQRMTAPLIVMIQSGEDHACARAAQRGALAALRDSPFGLMLFEAETASTFLLDDLRLFLERHRPQGAVVLPPLSALPGLADLCVSQQCAPIMLSPCDLPDAPRVLCGNDRQAMADATNYLVALGHQRIGLIAGPDNCLSSRECELGFIDALAAHDLDRGAELVAGTDGTFAAGEAAMQLLLDVSPRPTAILAATDLLAAGALKAALGKGIAIPADLSLVGFGEGAIADNLPIALTSLRPPTAEMAFAAATELACVDSPPQPAEFFASLVPRASTGPAPVRPPLPAMQRDAQQ
jgi:LacI family transcriptional regulator